jgi:hypothetical protein
MIHHKRSFILLLFFCATGSAATSDVQSAISAQTFSSSRLPHSIKAQRVESRIGEWAIPFRHPSLGAIVGLSANTHTLTLHEAKVDGGIHRTPCLNAGIQIAPISLLMITAEYFSSTYSTVKGGLTWADLSELKNSLSGFDLGLYAMFPLALHYDLATLLKSHSGFYLFGGADIIRGSVMYNYTSRQITKESERRETVSYSTNIRHTKPCIGGLCAISPWKDKRLRLVVRLTYRPTTSIAFAAVGTSASTKAALSTITPITDSIEISETVPLRLHAGVVFQL